MRAVIQRVSRASVRTGQELLGSISEGLVVLLAVAREDSSRDVLFLKRKILGLRLFDDAEGRMNRSLLETKGAVLLVSQFTLYGECRKGNRPSYSRAAPAETARALYRSLLEELRAEGVRVESGRFQARMEVELVNQGPVTLIVDSRKEG